MIRHRRKNSVSTPRKLAPPTATLCICIVRVCLLSWLITEMHIKLFSDAASKVVFSPLIHSSKILIYLKNVDTSYIFSLILSPVFSGLLPLLMTMSSNLQHLSNVG